MIKNFLDTLKKPSGEGIKGEDFNKAMADTMAEIDRTTVPAVIDGSTWSSEATTGQPEGLPNTPVAHVGQEAVKSVEQQPPALE